MSLQTTRRVMDDLHEVFMHGRKDSPMGQIYAKTLEGYYTHVCPAAQDGSWAPTGLHQDEGIHMLQVLLTLLGAIRLDSLHVAGCLLCHMCSCTVCVQCVMVKVTALQPGGG